MELLGEHLSRGDSLTTMAMLNTLLVTGADGRWSPGIGDPTLMGWVTVVAYFYAAYLAARAFQESRAQAHSDTRDQQAKDGGALAGLWLLVTVAMLLFVINKQLDLQTLFTEVARDLAMAQGWYEDRRKYQVAFIAVVGLLGGAGTAALAFRLRRVLGRVSGAVFGLGLIAFFVVVRAASFHHVDLLLTSGPIRLNWILELGGIGLIARSAYRFTPKRKANHR